MKITKKITIIAMMIILLGNIFIPVVNASQLTIVINSNYVTQKIKEHLNAISGITYNITTVSNSPYQGSLEISQEDLLKFKELDLKGAMNYANSLSDIAAFTHLEKLSMESLYSLTDTSALAGYTNLLDLSIMRGWLKQSEITGIEDLTTLEKLNLKYNSIENIDFMSDFVNMQELNIQYNNVKNISAVSNMPDLQTLTISENEISDVTPVNNLENLTTLNAFRINNSNVLEQLSGDLNLKSLDVGVNSISDISDINKFTKLETLSLEENSGLEDISSLESLSNLNWLKIRGNNISDLSPISNLTNLKTIDMSGITATDMSSLNKLTNLEWINFGYTKFSDVSALESLTSLKEIYARSAEIEDGTVFGKLDNLEKLDLEYNDIENIDFMTNLLDGSNTSINHINLYGNEIKDFTPVEGISDTIALEIKNQQITIKTNKTIGIELPTWIEKASDPNSICYVSSNPFRQVDNGTISSDMKTFDLSEGKTEGYIGIENVQNGVGWSDVSIILDIVAPTGSVSYNPSISNDKIITTITVDEEIQPVTGWTLSKDKKILTKEYTENMVEDITIIDEAGNEAIVNINVNKIDNIAPNSFELITGDITTNSITISGSTTDTGNSGVAPENTGVVKYEGQLLDSNNNILIDWTEDLTFKNLTQNTTYKVNMRATDKAGNIKQNSNANLKVKTLKVPSAISNILIEPEIVGATNENYNITLSSNISNFDIEYKIGAGNWIKYLNPFGMTENDLIFARFVDNLGQVTEEIATLQIKNIDKEAPNMFEFNVSKTINSIVVTGSTTDKGSIGAGNEYIAIERYEAQLLDMNDTILVDWTIDLSFEGLSEGTTYKVNMRAIDKAGNITESSNDSIEVTTNVREVVEENTGSSNNSNETEGQENTGSSNSNNQTVGQGNTEQNQEENSNNILDEENAEDILDNNTSNNSNNTSNNSNNNSDINGSNNNTSNGDSLENNNNNKDESNNIIDIILLIMAITLLVFVIYKRKHKK